MCLNSLKRSEFIKSDDEFFRVSGDGITRAELGMSFYYNLNGLTRYPYFGWSTNFEVSEKDIDEMMEKFMNILPEEIKHRLKVA